MGLRDFAQEVIGKVNHRGSKGHAEPEHRHHPEDHEDEGDHQDVSLSRIQYSLFAPNYYLEE